MKRAAIIIMTLLIAPSGLLHAEADSPDYYGVEGVGSSTRGSMAEWWAAIWQKADAVNNRPLGCGDMH